jgi:D-threo-aldose 1-dehydrogenase
MSLKDNIIGQLGFGTAPLGNMFRAIDEDEAAANVAAARAQGIRLFDTAPLYGAGLSETRLGKQPRVSGGCRTPFEGYDLQRRPG